MCSECDKTFVSEAELKQHVDNSCIAKLNKSDSLTCERCQKSFSRIDSLKRHVQQYCHIKNTADSDEKPLIDDKQSVRQDSILELRDKLRDEILIELKNELKLQLIDELKVDVNRKDNSDVKIGKVDSLVVNNNNVVNNISNGNTLNIQLVGYGKEDKTFTDLQLLKILNKGFLSVPELFKAIHYDSEKPENQNIYISNNRSDSLLVFNGTKWESKNIKETIEKIFDEGRNFLIESKDDLKERVAGKQRLMKMIAKFEYFDNDIDQYPKKKKEIFDELKYMMYNNRDMVMKTKKEYSRQTIEYITTI